MKVRIELLPGRVDLGNLPTRATVETRLAEPGLRVEMTAIAALD